MKKIIPVLLSCLIAFSMVGCASTTSSSNSAEKSSYDNGTYRGGYINPNEIEIEFVLKNEKFESFKFRKLSFNDVDYLKSEETMMVAIKTQYEQLTEHLTGKDISALKDLYSPEKIAKDIDVVTSATLRGQKLISAINDGLGRGPYSLPK